MEIDEIIEKAVERTVLRLRMSGVIPAECRDTIQKTEELLSRYRQFELSDQPYTRKVLAQIDSALKSIQDDPYYRIIPCFYIDKVSRERLAEDFGVTERTISRNKGRLVEDLAAILFSDDTIMKILCE